MIDKKNMLELMQKEVQTTQLSFVVVGDFDAKSY